MGFHTSWVAVRGAPLSRVLSLVGWRTTGEPAEFPEIGLYAAALPDGWVVLVGSGWAAMERVTAEMAERLSQLGDVVYLTQDDTSMNPTIAGYRGGRGRWSVLYDGTDGVSEPDVSGDVPEGYDAIVLRCGKEQEAAGGSGAGVDYMYEIVPELGRALVGFRHDEGPEGEEPVFVVEA